jgi:hypothetical protein
MTSKELKSKVMALGNRLSARMGRRAAFVRARAIVKAGGLELVVRGVSLGGRQEALRRLTGYAPERVIVSLVPEPTNPVDPAAVMVGVSGGRGLYRLGYVPRDMTHVAAAMGGQDHGLKVVSGVWGRANKAAFGARLALGV